MRRGPKWRRRIMHFIGLGTRGGHMPKTKWIDVGALTELSQRELQPVTAKRMRIALSYREGQFSAISGLCNHVGGPLGEGKLDGDWTQQRQLRSRRVRCRHRQWAVRIAGSITLEQA